jgi:hypothetical protein
MKQVFILIAAVISTLSLLAQSQMGITSFNKSAQSSVIYNLPYSEEAVWNGIENKMNAFGKPKKVKGFWMYNNVRIPEISTQPLSMYFSADKKSNKDKANATLTMMLANEFDRFYSLEENGEIFAKAKIFLNDFEAPVAAASLELQIKEQDDEVKKSDKKLKNLKNDGIDYENQKKKLEAKITQNTQDVTNQEQELAQKKEQLDALIKQRKN